MVQDKLSAFFPPVCACLEMTAARACSSQQQASGRLSCDLGGKGVKAERLAVASTDASAWPGVGELRGSCRGQRTGRDCEEAANWLNCGGKTLGPLSGSCLCLSGLYLVTDCAHVCLWENLRTVTVCVHSNLHTRVVCTLHLKQTQLTNKKQNVH